MPWSTDFKRRAALLCVIGTALLVGVPMWVWTTTVYRAPLNYSLMDYYDTNIGDIVRTKIPVYLNTGQEFPDLAAASQLVVDAELKKRNITNWGVDIRQGKGSYKDYNVDFRLGDEALFVTSEMGRELAITYTLELVGSGEVPELVSTVLLDYVFTEELKMFANNAQASSKVVDYSPNYHLTFSLFVGDGKDVSWDIVPALENYFTPLRKSLSRVANFTIDTQVQHYSTPATDIGPPNEEGVRVLRQDQLPTFVNYADWSLTSIHSYPTLHFILYVPAEDDKPLKIENSEANGFTIPQWGGVVIMNPHTQHLNTKSLLPALETFSAQLLSLLGAPSLPRSPEYRVDTLARISSTRALLSAASTLGSLHRLSKSLPNIAIPPQVMKSVNEAFDSIQQALELLKQGKWNNAIVHAGRSLQRAEAAFFDKMMVGQTFFPDEHKIAVYLPLLGPVSIVILMGSIRMFKEYKSGVTEKPEKPNSSVQPEHKSEKAQSD